MKKLLTSTVAASLLIPVLFTPSAIAGEDKAVAASEQEENTARKEIEAAYSRMMAAMGRKDLKGVFGEYKEDAVFIDGDGRRTLKAEEEKIAAESFEIVESIGAWTALHWFMFHGESATAIVTTSVRVVLPESKNEHRSMLDVRAIGMDSWVKRDDKWLISHSKTITKYATMYGNFLPKE